MQSLHVVQDFHVLKYNRLLSTGTFTCKTNNSNFITPAFTRHGHIHAWTIQFNSI